MVLLCKNDLLWLFCADCHFDCLALCCLVVQKRAYGLPHSCFHPFLPLISRWTADDVELPQDQPASLYRRWDFSWKRYVRSLHVIATVYIHVTKTNEVLLPIETLGIVLEWSHLIMATFWFSTPLLIKDCTFFWQGKVVFQVYFDSFFRSLTKLICCRA